jgi:uncharacterized DUF497 family protein
MSELRFEWNPRKSAENKKKHGVSFEEGAAVFYDENALLISDPDHSDEEDRFILLGLSASLRTLVVCRCYCKGGDVIRIISARKATREERGQCQQRYKR